MRTLRRVGFALIYVVFTVIGLVMALTATGSDRLIGAGIAAFFGFGGAGLWLVRRRTGASERRIGIVDAHGRPEHALVFPLSKSRAIGGLVILAGFVIMAIVFLLETDEFTRRPPWLIRGISWLILGVAPLGFWVFVSTIRHGGYLALTPSGIVTRRPGWTFVPWDAVDEAKIIEVYGQRMVGLRLSDPEALQAAGKTRALHVGSRTMFGVDVSYPESRHEASAETMLETIVYYLEHPEERRSIGTTRPS